jgi:ribosomal protein S18 acetylase RimI-like enzyme
MPKERIIHNAWSITPDAANDEAYTVLNQDRIVNCFALADLLPPFQHYTRIAIAAQAQTRRVASLLIVKHPQVQVLASFGDSEGVAALLASVDLPAQTLIQTLPEHWPLFQPYYALPASARELLRMKVSASTFRRLEQAAATPEYLRLRDLPAALALYDHFPASHFRPALLNDQMFFGVREGAGLVAAGGTHVIAFPYGLAVLGNIFTHPEHRGRGYAQAVTSTLVADLLDQGCQDVILNVDAANAPAIHVYTKLGFQPHCRVWSAQASLLKESEAAGQA